MPEKVYSVLFLSQRNSARSIMAEAILNSIGKERFRAFSAGVRPAPSIEPLAIELLQHVGLPTGDLHVKHYEEFTHTDAPALDFVFTLSDTAAGEAPPAWPGHPITAHWPSTDPVRFAPEGPDRRLSLIRTRSELERRLRIFVNLPFESLDRLSTRTHIDGIATQLTASQAQQ